MKWDAKFEPEGCQKTRFDFLFMRIESLSKRFGENRNQSLEKSNICYVLTFQSSEFPSSNPEILTLLQQLLSHSLQCPVKVTICNQSFAFSFSNHLAKFAAHTLTPTHWIRIFFYFLKQHLLQESTQISRYTP